MIRPYLANGVVMGELITGQAATYVEEIWVETEKRYQIILSLIHISEPTRR